MKLLTFNLAFVLLTAVALAQAPADPAPKPPTPPPTDQATPDQVLPPSDSPLQAARDQAAPTPVDAESVQQAEALLKDVAAAYKKAPTLTDTVEIKVEVAQMPMGMEPPPTQELKIKFGQGANAQISTPGMRMTALDGHLYVEQDRSPDQYLRAPLQDDMVTTLALLQGGESGLPPHFAFRAEKGMEEYLEGLSLGLLGEVKLTGHQMAKNGSGEAVHEVTFAGPLGQGAAHIKAQSKFLERVMLDIAPPGMPKSKAIISMNPQVAQSLSEPITFEAGDRRLVEVNLPVQVGKPAPDFTLPTLDDQPVTLSELRGNVVVLDFWATWCPPCVHGLPLLNEFAKWATESGEPIKVYAVNVMERVESEQRRAKVQGFWTAKGFTMQTLLDADDSVANRYGFSSLPTTLIIGQDGIILAIHRGLQQNMVETLKAETLKALGKQPPEKSPDVEVPTSPAE